MTARTPSDKRMVFIFDECHRSQFGDNHQAIKEFFPKAQLFGFTGTPIFEENATVKRSTAKSDAPDDPGPFPATASRIHDHSRHRGPQRPPLPRTTHHAFNRRQQGKRGSGV